MSNSKGKKRRPAIVIEYDNFEVPQRNPVETYDQIIQNSGFFVDESPLLSKTGNTTAEKEIQCADENKMVFPVKIPKTHASIVHNHNLSLTNVSDYDDLIDNINENWHISHEMLPPSKEFLKLCMSLDLDIEFVRQFVRKNTVQTINMARIPYGKGVLHFATINRNLDLMAILLKTSGLIVNMTDELGHTPLHTAVINDDLEAVLMIISHGRKRQLDLFIRDNTGKTVFHWATLNGNVKILEVLLDAVKINVFSATRTIDENGRTPLHLAYLKLDEAKKTFDEDLFSNASNIIHALTLKDREVLQIEDIYGRKPCATF